MSKTNLAADRFDRLGKIRYVTNPVLWDFNLEILEVVVDCVSDDNVLSTENLGDLALNIFESRCTLETLARKSGDVREIVGDLVRWLHIRFQ